jgi:hypothetical protein
MNNKQKIFQSREQKNEKYKHISLEMETSTHFPMLIKTIQMTNGLILEVGSGVFSTPLIHWLCFADKRRVITVEKHLHYLDFAKKFTTPWHEVVAIKDIGSSKLMDEYYSVVFIDHTPKKPTTRGDDALLFKDKCDFLVLHDAGPNFHAKYGYDKTYPAFKYRHDWTGYKVNTTVLSNTIDVSKWT